MGVALIVDSMLLVAAPAFHLQLLFHRCNDVRSKKIKREGGRDRRRDRAGTWRL